MRGMKDEGETTWMDLPLTAIEDVVEACRKATDRKGNGINTTHQYQKFCLIRVAITSTERQVPGRNMFQLL